MTKFIVSVFADEKAAYEGSRALQSLDSEGSIVLYSSAVISKDSDGNVQMEDANDEGPIGTATGMLIGSLIGVLGGPAGMVFGAAAGSLTGWLTDLYNVGVDGQFLDDVSTQLAPGKFAVIAEVSEGWTAPLDTRMEQLGGSVLRRGRIDVEDQQIQRDCEATERDLAELEAEWDDAVGESKEKLKAKVDATRDKLQSLQKRATEKVDSLKAESQAKLHKLNEQIEKCNDDFKEKFEKRRNEIKADYEARIQRLKGALSKKPETISA